MRSAYVLAALSVACLTIPWNVAAAEPAASGVVVDSAKQPVEGAKVSLLVATQDLPEPTVVADAVTDKEGRFSIAWDAGESKPVNALVAVMHPNFGINWVMGEGPPSVGRLRDLSIALLKGAEVSGIVVDPSGKPVPGAVITAFISRQADSPQQSILSPSEQVLKAESGKDGSFRLAGIPENARVAVGAKHPGFAPGTDGMPEQARGMPQPTIEAGATSVTIRLSEACAIEGKVTVEGSGVAVPSARVTLMPTGPAGFAAIMWGRPPAVVADAAGRYAIADLGKGQYAVSVKHPDYAAAVTPVDLTSNRKATADIVLGKGVLVSGKFVKAGTAEPVTEGAQIWVRRKEGNVAGETVDVKPDGTFAFRAASGGITMNASVEIGSLPRESSQKELTLSAGQDVTDIVFEVQPPLIFKGRVIGTDGKPIAGAEVSTKRGGSAKPRKSDENGAFEVALPSYQSFGEWEHLFLQASHPDKPDLRGILLQPLRSQEDLKGDITCKRKATVAGRVSDESGKPLAGIPVRDMVRGENIGISDANVTTDAEGRYKFEDIVPGLDYSITASGVEHGQANADRFSLAEGETKTLEDFVLAPANMRIEGTVEDQAGKPLPGVRIRCNGQGTGNREAQSDDKGHFVIEHLVDESVDLFAWHEGANGNARGIAAGDTDMVLVMGQQQPQQNPQERAARILVDKAAPELEVAAWVQHGPVSLETLRGKTVVLVLWDSAGKASAETLSFLEQMQTKCANSGMGLLAVDAPNADAKALKHLLSEHKITCPVGVSADSSSANGGTFAQYKLNKAPGVYLIDADGVVKYQDLPFRAVDQALAAMTKTS